MVIIYKARDTTEAHIVRGMLEANGIEAYVNGFYLQGGIGELAAHDYASVSVLDEHAELAKNLVKAYDNEALITGESDDSNQ